MVCLHEEGHARLNGMKFNCQFISMRFLFLIYFRLTSPNLHLNIIRGCRKSRS